MFNLSFAVAAPTGSLRMRPLALAVMLALGASSAYLTPAYAADAAVQSAVRHYDLPAAPLAQTLNRIARDAGLSLTFNAELIGNLKAAPVSGNYTAQQAIEQALGGTGLQLVTTPVGSLSLQKRVEVSSVDTTLPEVQVVAILTATSEGTGSYAAAATTIGKSAQSLRHTPQSVSVMTRQRLDDQGIRTLDDALLQTPGILVEQSSTWERTFYSRGFEVDAVQYDGVPSLRGAGFFASPDLAGFDRVEVLRGPAGLFNGAGQPGGTVNLVRKRPTLTNQVNFQANAGSWNNKRVGVDVNRILNDSGDLRGRLVAAYEDREYFYDLGNTKRSVLYGIVEKDISPDTTLGFGINYETIRMNQPFYGGLPRYSDGRDIGFPRSTYFNAAWSYTNVETNTLFTDLNHRFNDDWKLKIGLSHMSEKSHGVSGSVFGTYNPALPPSASSPQTRPTLSAFWSPFDSEQTTLDATLIGSFSAFGQKHDVLVGANYMKREYNNYSQLYTVAGNIINDPLAFDPWDYATAPTVPARAATNTLATVKQSGLYGSLRISLSDPLKLLIGGRFSNYETFTKNLVTGANSVAPYKDTWQFTPYTALTYDLNPNWTVYGSYTEIFRSQANLFDVNGQRLDPMTGQNLELGLKGSLINGRLNTSVALFQTVQSNRSQTVIASPCPVLQTLYGNTAACYAAEGEVRSQGLDAEISGAITPSLQVSAGYTYNETKYLRDRAASGAPTANEGLALSTFTPRHIMRVWSNWRLPNALSDWSLGGGVNFQSTSFKTSGTARLEQKSYAVWNARIGYAINPKMSLALNLNNIFDKHYYRTLGSVSGSNWYGEPRNAMLTLNASF